LKYVGGIQQMRRNCAAIFLFLMSIVQAGEGPLKLTQLPKPRANSPKISAGNNYKICALRVSFITDDDVKTTGDGNFLQHVETDTLCQAFRIDPPPHNRAYFRDHIRSVANYYLHASNGNMIIDTTNSYVFPLNDSETYTLAQTMDYYHPFLNDELVDVRLAELLADAVSAADGSVNFADFDIVVVFHAGVGQDFAIDLDPTPYDIPSAYMNFSDLQNVFANNDPGYAGIAADDSTTFIRDGIILPESQNHLHYDNWEDVFATDVPCEYQFGLNGTFALMLGSYLGIPSLYNTETGVTGVGKFGFMDQGSANLNGLIPAMPTAWTRVYMNWVKPVIAANYEEISLEHAESANGPWIYKIPISSDEYFLVENRNAHIRPDVSLDSIQYRIYLKSNEENWPSVLPLIRDSSQADFSDETGVLLSVPRYDIGLPGSGLLIWHIDEAVIREKISLNNINGDRTHHGVDLEEGDGAQDFGYESNAIGTSPDIGWYFDPWLLTMTAFGTSILIIRKTVFVPSDSGMTHIRTHAPGPVRKPE